MTYGTFRPNGRGELYPAPTVVAGDFADIAENGFSAVRTYTVPPRWLLDLAAEAGLFVMVGIAWEQHVDFLEDRRRTRSIEDRIRAGVAACAGHPAVLCYTVGNEIPSPIVRWLGRRRVERHIARLCRAAKSEDPGGLVTYVNYPPTEYLQLPFLDFACFNVYLENQTALDAYLARLQNIAGDLPLVMAEIGLDSRTHGELRQANVLDWQIRTAFAAGCTGAFVFAWTDEWYVSYLSETGTADGGEQIEDWDFGLTSRDRRPKLALEGVRGAFVETPFEPGRPWPRVSVVVCTFNGEETIGGCLEGLRELDYPDYEVIVVNDGSTDSTPAIVRDCGFRLINTENRGLAAARNTGMRAATGEIVAYLDDDARPDRDWLSYLVVAFERGPYMGVGGPNVAPTESAVVASCIADSPGGPTHVLVSDREAEHIPGCNMAFRKTALEEVGGFDPQFRVAGDDVDICWRVRAAGHKLGFSPAALVWHRPRATVGAYWRQQRAYGRAEAMLERKWPEKYSANGHAHWSGRLYRNGLHAGLGRWRVYYGTWGSALFQSLYAPGGGALSSVLLSPVWYLAIATLALLSIGALLWSLLVVALPLLASGIAVAVVFAATSASRTDVIGSRTLPPRALASRWLLTTLLHLLQPLARVSGRLGASGAPRAHSRRFATPFPRLIKTWTETWQPGFQRLAEMESALRKAGATVSRGGVYDRWDLQARHGVAAAVRVRMGVEEHGAGRQLVRVHLAPRYSRAVLALLVVLSLLAFAAWISDDAAAAALLGGSAVAVAARAVQSAGFAMAAALRQVHGSTEGGWVVGREVRRLKVKGT